MWQSSWMAGVRLVRYAPGSSMREHAHAQASLCLLVDGGYEERIRGRADAHAVGHMMFCPAHAPHAQRFSAAGALKVLVEPRAQALDFLHPRTRLADAPFAASAHLQLLGRRLAAELAAADDDGARLAVEGLVLEALAEFGRRADAGAGTHRPAWLRQAREFVHAHACAGFTLEAMAAALGRHPVHVARTFRTAFGCSVGAMARQVRLEHAVRRLLESSLPIAEVASACGFSDQAHLTRSIRAAHGTTPARLRRGG